MTNVMNYWKCKCVGQNIHGIWELTCNTCEVERNSTEARPVTEYDLEFHHIHDNWRPMTPEKLMEDYMAEVYRDEQKRAEARLAKYRDETRLTYRLFKEIGLEPDQVDYLVAMFVVEDQGDVWLKRDGEAYSGRGQWNWVARDMGKCDCCGKQIWSKSLQVNAYNMGKLFLAPEKMPHTCERDSHD